jgi:hypothetical protein
MINEKSSKWFQVLISETYTYLLEFNGYVNIIINSKYYITTGIPFI